MQPLPLLTPEHALFLDFDGTLADIAPHPDAVRVPTGLVPTLSVLQAQLGGALAILTGRRESDVDAFLGPLRLPVASEHGACWRLPDGTHPEVPAPDLTGVRTAAEQLAAAHPGLLVEHKRATVALHYRHAQHLESLCLETMAAAAGATEGVELMHGKCVVEVKPEGVNKGRALAGFMAFEPFRGRVPVFAGDDVTDEAGFVAAQSLGGRGIKIGEGPTQALHRCLSPATFRGWLAAARTALPPVPPLPPNATWGHTA
ncbi:MAG: trehalose-phosphatase [Burkholderiales bacterium]|nr:trehalose-phosphatase [Burkholderiales bacterium]